MKLALILFTSILSSSIMTANAEENSVSKNEDFTQNSKGQRVPQITLIDAITKLLKFCDESHGKDAVYVDEAKYIKDTNLSYWRIGIRSLKEETGLLLYKVSPSGEIEQQSMVKDR